MLSFVNLLRHIIEVMLSGSSSARMSEVEAVAKFSDVHHLSSFGDESGKEN